MSQWSTRSVLVTGATGMVGSNLCRRLLDEGARVVGLIADDDPTSELARSGTLSEMVVMSGRLERYDDVERAINNTEVDTVIHLGAQPIVGAAARAPRHTFETNIQGTWNVLDACRLIGSRVQRVVVASSDKAYGAQTVLPYLEDMPLAGVQPYEVSKSCTDLIALSYAKTYGSPVAVARCGNIYGPGDLNWNRIVPGTMRSLIRGAQPVIRSDGSLIRDYLHVDDVTDAYLTLADRADSFAGEAFNFSDESPMSVLEIYAAICDAAGMVDTAPSILGEASDEIPAQYLNASKARDLLGWAPTVPLGDGLAQTFAWYQAFLGASS
ncbi:MAG: NAD-dependent epimerase/dehydratase family protein [Actinomycetota bacterium]|nr:NAD-dependent epimerase/dehydratase family protein [Actinomycetota bacterium]